MLNNTIAKYKQNSIYRNEVVYEAVMIFLCNCLLTQVSATNTTIVDAVAVAVAVPVNLFQQRVMQL